MLLFMSKYKFMLAIKIRMLLFIAFIAINTLVFGQTIGKSPQFVTEPKFQSPNAAALGKFGDTPISYHTGVPEISIPLYTVQEGSLSVPISISYHSSGVRVDEMASWVGLGWSLSAGGSITRTINGGPDEGRAEGVSYNDSYGSDCGPTGWYKDYGKPSCLNLDNTGCGSPNPNNGKGTFIGSTCWSRYMAASRGFIDTEPDLYSFNFPGHSGKFFFDNNRKPHMISENDYLIIPEQAPNLFRTWKIISPDGTKYFFGGTNATENSYSGSNYFTPSDQNKSSTTWHLTKIESPNGENWIQFEYEPEKSSYGTKASHTYVLGFFGHSGNISATRGYSLTSTDGFRISRITTNSAFVTVDFNESSFVREDLTSFTDGDNITAEAKPLDNIRILYGDKCKVFSFGFTYFLSERSSIAVAPDTPFDAKRLKLLSLKETTCDNTVTKPPYLFFYNETEPLPRRYSFSQDHWGYFNGQGNLMLLPNDAINPATGYSLGTAIRSANETKMKVGILEKIVYPTGGYSSFSYEAHKENPTSPSIVGGLRVKTVNDSDGFGNTISKTINYLQGTLYAPITNSSYSQDPRSNSFNFNSNLLDWGIIFNSAPNPPLQSTHGYHIGYSIVEVDFGGIGKSTYRYYNNAPQTSSQYPRVPTISVVGTGLPYSEEHFDALGNGLQSVTYQYDNTGGSTSVTGRKLTTASCFNTETGVGSPPLTYDCSFESVFFTDYTLSTYRNNLISKTEYKDGVTKVTNYTYDPTNKHNNPKSEETVNSDGTAFRAEYTYPTDAGSGAPTVLSNPSDPDFKNMLGILIDKKVFAKGSLINEFKNYFEQSGTRALLTSSKSFPSGTSDFTENRYEYDVNSNILNITRSNGVTTSFVWGYNNSLPIAEVTNAHSNQIFYTSFEESTSSITYEAHSGKKGYSGSFFVSLPSSGYYTLSYWQKEGDNPWQYFEVNNLNSNRTIGGIGYSIDDVRLFPMGALMTTYNYDIGVGISSSTDPNNVTSYYEYDLLGRLLAIRDNDGNLLKAFGYNFKK
jgi:YD repeat-containing protein